MPNRFIATQNRGKESLGFVPFDELALHFIRKLDNFHQLYKALLISSTVGFTK